MNIKDFLLARIAEDEGTAEWVVMAFPDGDVAPLYRRVLAECKAKRALAEGWQDPATVPGWYGERAEGAVEELDTVVRTLASVYADHPDYQKEWAVQA